jgi:Flp pilus assembly CpaF family ATPase
MTNDDQNGSSSASNWSFLDEIRRQHDDTGREPQFMEGRGGRRMVSQAALLERIVNAFIDEHGTDSQPLLEADTEGKRLKLLLGTVDYVLAVEGVQISADEKADIMRRAYAELFSYGPLDGLFADERITTILLEGADKASVRYGHADLTKLDPIFEDESHLRKMIRRLAREAGVQLNGEYPIMELGLRVNNRRICLNLAMPPVTFQYTADIRLHPPQPPTLDSMVEAGVLPQSAGQLLRAIAQSPYGVIVVGEAESGKTSLLAVLANLASDGQGMIAVERAGELHLPKEAERLSVRWPSDTDPGMTFGEQIGAALAKNPAVILLDEVRADEPYAIVPLLADDTPPRQMWAFRGPADSKRLASALGMVARRGDASRSEQYVLALYQRLPFVVTVRRAKDRLQVRTIAEWQFTPQSDYPDYVELMAAGWEGIERTGRRPVRELALPADFWE